MASGYNGRVRRRRCLKRSGPSDMFLAIDIGNTTITLGVFAGEGLKARWRLSSDVYRTAAEYGVLLRQLLESEGIPASSVQAAALASVVPSLVPVFEEVCRRYFAVRPLVVDTGVRTGMRIVYDNPRDVGADRVADAVAGVKLYGTPLIIVDFGTATVFDAVSKDGDYLGGAIAPGIAIAAEALFQRTAKLPRVELERPRAAIGKNTVMAMQSGIVFGYVGLVEAMIERFQQELGGGARVVATGGWAHLIARETAAIQVVNMDLTLVGLRIIYQMNRG